MDFKRFYFDSEKDMLFFVDKHWERVFNVFHVTHPDAGQVTGWMVQVIYNTDDECALRRRTK